MASIVSASNRILGPCHNMRNSWRNILIATWAHVELHRCMRTHVSHQIQFPIGPLRAFYNLSSVVCCAITR